MTNQATNPAERQSWRPSEEERFATKPTGWTRFIRVFLPYQIWRYLVINLKMMRIIFKGHGHS
ncbi:MAG: hypothetical protein H6829_04785 [Planctomycetes bacterium]|nr:hypothetical protein [Planctomycetota bacterium]MCB9911944.1 hypothetical protein [Planctomycetota bacterium]HPF13628.1 hypothetical protein [Planctomycetota bacterium]HRV80512.1 hypothetical protein [Planctomycetota bacterium]